jgi:excisionase family DNA binding protein
MAPWFSSGAKKMSKEKADRLVLSQRVFTKPGNQAEEHCNRDLISEPLKTALDQIRIELSEIRDLIAGTRKPYLTVEEVAQITGRSAYTVRRWISEKRLVAERIAGIGPKGRLLIPREQLGKLILEGKGGNIPDPYATAKQ